MNRLHTLGKTILAGFGAIALALSSIPTSAQEPQYYSQAELDQMLAPIALYPDTVLSHVLIAATYPLEVVQAARWSRDTGYSREYAVDAASRMDWAPSVATLVAFPELLDRMDRDLDWTQRLGDAFLMQEADVLDTIQYLRDEAYAHGHLRTNEHVRVVRETRYIYIEPARSRVVYVPYYDPRIVYGSWRWASHPPTYWHRPAGFRVSIGFHWGSGYRVQPRFYSSSFHWSQRQVVVVNNHYYGHRGHGKSHGSRYDFHSGRDVARHADASRWSHNPQHRRGVDYRPGTDERHLARSTSTSSRQSTGNTRDTRRASLQERGSSASGSSSPTPRSAAPADTRRAAAASTSRQRIESGSSDSRRTSSLAGRGDSRSDHPGNSRSASPGASRSTSRSDRLSDSLGDSLGNRLGNRLGNSRTRSDGRSTDRREAVSSRSSTRSASATTSRESSTRREAARTSSATRPSTRRDAAPASRAAAGSRASSTRSSSRPSSRSSSRPSSRSSTLPAGRSAAAATADRSESRSARSTPAPARAAPSTSSRRAAVQGRQAATRAAPPARSRSTAPRARATSSDGDSRTAAPRSKPSRSEGTGRAGGATRSTNRSPARQGRATTPRSERSRNRDR